MLSRTVAKNLRNRAMVFLGLVLVLLFTQPGHTQGPNSPTFFKNYFVTGDTIVVSKGLTSLPSDSSGLLHTTIAVLPKPPLPHPVSHPPKTIDCIVAQACLDSGASLLTRDRDFEVIARHSRLRLVAA